MNTEDINSPKKLREARAVRAFTELEHLSVHGNLRAGIPGKEPDFVLYTGDAHIGIEVVEYFTPALNTRWRLKERDKLAERILAGTTRQCNAVGIRNVFASVEFDDDAEINNADVRSVVNTLTHALRRVSCLKGSVRLRPRQTPRCIADVWAHYRSTIDETFVGRSWGRVVEPADETELLRLIAKKEAKFTSYRQNCSGVWLLMIVDQWQPASIGYVPPDYRLSASVFDRVVVLQGWSYIIDLWRRAA